MVTQSGTSLEINLDDVVGGDGLADTPFAYEIRVMAKDSSGYSAYSDTITIIDSPIVAVNGNSKLPPGQHGPVIGKAVVNWISQSRATSYTLRWRMLGSDREGDTHTEVDWDIDSVTLPGVFAPNDKKEGIQHSRTSFEITPLATEEIYAHTAQLPYNQWMGLLGAGRLRMAVDGSPPT